LSPEGQVHGLELALTQLVQESLADLEVARKNARISVSGKTSLNDDFPRFKAHGVPRGAVTEYPVRHVGGSAEPQERVLEALVRGAAGFKSHGVADVFERAVDDSVPVAVQLA